MRIPTTFPRRILTAACLGLIGLLPYANAEAAPGTPDTLITGHLPAGQTSKHVAVSVGGVACPIVAGGAVDASRAYQVVVTSCGPGTANLIVDGLTTAFTFQVRPGVWVEADKQSAANITKPTTAGQTPNHIPATTATATRPAKPLATPAKPLAPPKQPARAAPAPVRSVR